MNEVIKVIVKKLQALECPVCKTKVRVELLGGDNFNTVTCGHEEVKVLVEKTIYPTLR